MKATYLIIGLVILLAACSTPPDDLARAEVTNQGMGSRNTMDGSEINDSMDQVMDDPVGIHTMAIDPAKSSFEFQGYGPGKSHLGTFTELSGTLTMDSEGNIIGSAGTIQAASVTSESERLENHLRSEDFFDIENHPTITWESTSVESGEMVGDLTFLGVTKSITIPITLDGTSMSADFLLDTRQFGMKYPAVNDDVRIAFTVAS